MPSARRASTNYLLLTTYYLLLITHCVLTAYIGQALFDGPGGTATCSQCGEAGVRVDEVIPNRQLREVPPPLVPHPPTHNV